MSKEQTPDEIVTGFQANLVAQLRDARATLAELRERSRDLEEQIRGAEKRVDSLVGAAQAAQAIKKAIEVEEPEEPPAQPTKDEVDPEAGKKGPSLVKKSK